MSSFELASSSGFEPLPHQQEPLSVLSQARNSQITRGYLDMATGTGKTVVAAHDVRDFLAENPEDRVLVLCHDSNILKQNHKTFSSILGTDSHGYLFGGQFEDQEKIVYATFQTMTRPLGGGRTYEAYGEEEFDYVVVDESHHGPADTYEPVIRHFRPKFLLGLTSIPDRQDQRDIKEIFGEPLYRLPLEQAIAEGWLAKPDYRLLSDKVASLEDIQSEFGEKVSIRKIMRNLFVKKREEEIIEEINRNIVNSDIEDPRMVIFCPGIEYAEHLSDLMPKNAKTLHSGLPTDVQDKRLEQFRTGEIETIIAVDKLNEGVDVPETNVVVFLRSTESRGVFLQQLGRGLRKIPGKDSVLVLDFAGSWNRIKMVRDLKSTVRRKAARVGKKQELQSIEEPFEFNFSAEAVTAMEVIEKAREARKPKSRRRPFQSRSAKWELELQELKDMLGVDELPDQRLTERDYKSFDRMIRRGTPGAQEGFLLRCLRRAYAVAKKEGKFETLTEEDHFQNAMAVLAERLPRMVSGGQVLDVKQLAFAIWTGIWQAKQKQGLIRLPTSAQQQINKIELKSQELAKKLGRQPTDEEIALSIGLSQGDLEEVRLTKRLLSYDNFEPIEKAEGMIDISDTAQEAAEKVIKTEGMQAVLEELNYRKRRVLGLRYGLNGNAPQSLDDVGRTFNVTRERIRQIENQTLKELRKRPDTSKLSEAGSEFKPFVVLSADPLVRVAAGRLGYIALNPDSEYDQSAWESHPRISWRQVLAGVKGLNQARRLYGMTQVNREESTDPYDVLISEADKVLEWRFKDLTPGRRLQIIEAIEWVEKVKNQGNDPRLNQNQLQEAGDQIKFLRGWLDSIPKSLRPY